MKRRTLLGHLAGSLAASGASAQTTARRRIGILVHSANNPFLDGFKTALSAIGYQEGRNIEILYRDARGRDDLTEQAAQELVRAEVEAIVAWSTSVVQALMQATKRIPIVAYLADPVGSGLVTSLARPEANLTGVSGTSFDVAAKRIDLLLEGLPATKPLGFVGLTGEPNMRRFFNASLRATRDRVGLRLIEVGGPSEIEAALTAARDGIAGATLQPIFNPQSREMGALTARLKLPACGANRSFAEAGGLMTLDGVVEDGYRRMAHVVDRVLAGVAVANLPIEQLSRTHLIVNQRAAAALKLAIPPTLLARADEIIE